MTVESTRHYYRDYAQYQSHGSVEQLNESIRAHLFEHKASLTKSAVAIFKLLGRYSCVFPGVSWLKCATIGKYADKSDKTVRTALKALEDCGMIKRIATQRKQGGRGHYVYIITRKELPEEITGRPIAEKPHDSTDKKAVELKETLKNTVDKKDVRNAHNLDESFTPSHIHNAFTKACKPFFGAYRIYRLWGTVKAAYAKSALEIPLEHVMDTVIQAFKESVFAFKVGRVKGELGGYFYGALRGMLAVIRRKEVAETRRAYDWLAQG
ncbi:putative transcriptional regulator [Pullulanibacillus pueri]|uniref:Helix-turn-helix domain-containing protein n=1 Tax=Pullulanibacillus pueri TaxID=1437324 RepID=A0A8J2ZYE2_9BACL|nr:hypothetical protein [Pullulanibacillus pueri]MBM7683743.1 putative transcriptional regulator [Pullulanibacillus pueri]GGH85102.1 hypothetical protein GCM10007096_29710 [Pullulanibacillus pueri]